MLIFALALAPALAADVVVVEGSASTVVVTTEGAPAAAPAPERDDDEDEDDRYDARFQAGSTISALTDGIAQSAYARVETRRDGYLEVYGRGQRCGCWVGRVGAGFDVFGDGAFDLNLGLFVGAAGSDWGVGHAEVGTSPQLGTQIAVGLDGRHLVARYTWLAGIGGGAGDALVTENQLQLGVKVARIADVYGEVLYLDPGAADSQAGLGLGARLTF